MKAINESHGNKKHNFPKNKEAAQRKGNRDAERDIFGDGFKAKDRPHKGKEYNRKQGKKVNMEELDEIKNNRHTIKINESHLKKVISEVMSEYVDSLGQSHGSLAFPHDSDFAKTIFAAIKAIEDYMDSFEDIEQEEDYNTQQQYLVLKRALNALNDLMYHENSDY